MTQATYTRVEENIRIQMQLKNTYYTCFYYTSLDTLHTGIFAQNSFQIDSINSCRTSKKLEFKLKIF